MTTPPPPPPPPPPPSGGNPFVGPGQPSNSGPHQPVPLPPPPGQPGQPPQYAQPPYGAPYSNAPYGNAPYGAAPYGYPPSYPKTWMNIVALVTGLICCSPAAIVFGHLGMSASNRGEAQYKGMAIAGLILGYLGLLYWLFWSIGAIASFSTY